MELLHDWERTGYAQEIGPGVYDIHSPRVPPAGEMAELLAAAARVLPPEQLWVNPDCGLKTRAWPETEAALRNLVQAAQSAPRRAGPSDRVVQRASYRRRRPSRLRRPRAFSNR